MTADTGLTANAISKRLARLKEKIESSPAFGEASGQVRNHPTTGKSTVPIKRKANTVSKQEKRESLAPKSEGHADVSVKEEAAPEAEVPKRKTRGRQIDFNAMFHDDPPAPRSIEDSEDDYMLDDAVAKEEGDDVELNSGDDAKPAAKRRKKDTSSVAKAPANPTPMSRVDGKKTTITSPRKAAPVSTATAKCAIHSSQKLVPSIEKSPPLPPTPQTGNAKRFAPQTDGDIDLKSFQPGTFIALPPKRQQPVSPIMSTAPSTLPESYVTAGARSMALSLASSQDSAGKLLQRDLDKPDTVRPEDSVSMVGREHTPPSPGKLLTRTPS